MPLATSTTLRKISLPENISTWLCLARYEMLYWYEASSTRALDTNEPSALSQYS